MTSAARPGSRRRPRAPAAGGRVRDAGRAARSGSARAARPGSGAAAQRAAWLVPALLALLLHAPSLGWGWVWDDHQLIEQNAALRAPAPLARALVSDFWATSGPDASGLWRPLVTLSYAVDGAVSHWNPAWFRAMNLLAHAGVSGLVAWVALLAGAPAWAALVAGSWFAVMPAHVESVAWISGRTDVLCALWFLVALGLDERARRRGAPWAGWGASVSLALALLAKETALPYVAVVAVAEWVRGSKWREAARWLAPYLAVTLVYLGVHTLLVHAPARPSFLDPQSVALGRRGVLLMLPEYLAFLWPFYPHTAAVTISLAEAAEPARIVVAAIVDLALAAAIAWAVARRRPLAVPLALLLFTLLPTLVVDVVRGYMLYAERFFYLPSAGAALLLGLALARAHTGARAVLAGVAAVLVATSAVSAWRTLPAWSSDLAQFSQQVERAPDNYQAHVQLARQLLDIGRDDQAARELDAATALDATRPEAMSVRAALEFRRGQWPQALAEARAALAHGDRRPEPALVAATALLALGRAGEAQGLVDTLEARAPDLPPVVSLHGQWLLATGHAAEAEPELDRAAAFDPRNADLAYMTGLAHEQAHHFPAAREAFRRALAIEPAHYDAWLGVARASMALGDAAATEAALARAEALPQARDGRAATLRAQARAQLGLPSPPPAAPGRP